MSTSRREPTCRPITVTVDGEEINALVRSNGPLTDQDREAIVELVAACRRLQDEPVWDGGPQLRDKRVIAGLTMRDLAKQVGCPPSRISRIEQGAEEPTAELLDKIEEVLR